MYNRQYHRNPDDLEMILEEALNAMSKKKGLIKLAKRLRMQYLTLPDRYIIKDRNEQ